MKTDLSETLNDCIDRLSKGESVGACLASYPEYATELEPLLRTAQVTLSLSRVVPDPARKLAAKRRFLDIASRELRPQRNIVAFPGRLRTIAASIAAAFLLMVGMAGTMAVSADSTPDDALYGVKRAAEGIQLFFAQDDDTMLHVELARRRLKELETIANRRGEIRSNLLAEVVRETETAIRGLDRANDKEKLGEQLLSLTTRQQEVLLGVFSKAPEEAREGLDRAIERSRKGHEAASTAISQSAGDEHKSNKDERKSGMSSPEPTAVKPAPTIDRSPGKGEGSRGDENKGGGEKSEERGKSPTATAENGTRNEVTRGSNPLGYFR